MTAGCTTVTTESFRVVQDTQVESASIATDADFSQYDTLHAEDMGIFFPRDAAPSSDDIQRLRQIFREAFLSRLGNYRIADRPGPGTMTVQATLIDLRESSGGAMMDMRVWSRRISAGAVFAIWSYVSTTVARAWISLTANMDFRALIAHNRCWCCST